MVLKLVADFLEVAIRRELFWLLQPNSAISPRSTSIFLNFAQSKSKLVIGLKIYRLLLHFLLEAVCELTF